MIVQDWAADGSPMGSQPGFVTAGGQSFVAITRRHVEGDGSPESYVEWTVADVDGPVRIAIRQARREIDPGCSLIQEVARDTSFAWKVRGDGHGATGESPYSGLVVSKLGSLVPSLRLRDEGLGTSNWAAGDEWSIRHTVGMFRLYDKSMSPVEPLLDPGGYPPDGRPLISGNQIIWQAGNYTEFGILSWSPTQGIKPLVRYIGDETRGAGNVGGDGVDLVWTYGEQRPDGEPLYPVRSIMTAPFTTDPSTLQPRRLRSDPSAAMGTQFKQFGVGCGHAGRATEDPASVLMVRLSDGWSWRLEKEPGWNWYQVLGITCDEAFVLVYESVSTGTVRYNVARVRLDSLGPGMAPD